MSDDNRVRLCLRLRDDADHHDGLGLRWRRDCREAADLIERQVAELGRLRAALRPFAAYAAWLGVSVEGVPDDLPVRSEYWDEDMPTPTVGDCRAAAAALGEGKE